MGPDKIEEERLENGVERACSVKTSSKRSNKQLSPTSFILESIYSLIRCPPLTAQTCPVT